MTTMTYAGIGSRKSPPEALVLMTLIAQRLAARGYTLRSGGAAGADLAFEKGVPVGCKKEIYLPAEGFNRSMSRFYPETLPCWAEAAAIARRFHPAWDKLSPFAKRLQIRNTYQVLGHELTSPSDFVVCWTPDGCMSHESRSFETGGTGQAISIASHHNIPVFNLFYGEVMLEKIADLVGKR